MWTRCRVNTRGTSCDDVNVGAERERGKEKEEEDFHLFSMSAQIFRFVLCFVLFYFGKFFNVNGMSSFLRHISFRVLTPRSE